MKKIIITSLLISFLFVACSIPYISDQNSNRDTALSQQNDTYKHNMFRIIQNDQWGYIDSRGNVVITPQFEFAGDFFEGYAAIKKDDKYGYIDETGSIQIQPKFFEAYSFSEGLACFWENSSYKFGYINKKGEVIIKPKFDFADKFNDGLALIKISDKYGYIDKNGNIMIKPQFDMAFGFSEGLAHVIINNKTAYIDKNANYIIEPKFAGDSSGLEIVGDFSDGLAPARIDNNSKWGYINKKGEFAIAPGYEFASDFSEGLAAVSYNGKYGYIDINGKNIVDSKYEEAYPFSEGLAMIKVEGSGYGYIDTTGKVIIEPIYLRNTQGVQLASKDFSGGIARVLEGNGTWGYINKKGQHIWKSSNQSSNQTPSNGTVSVITREVDPLSEEDFTITDGINIIGLYMAFKDLKLNMTEKLVENNYVGETTSGEFIYKYYMHQYDDFDLYVSNANYNYKGKKFDDRYVSQITLKNKSDFKTARGITISSALKDVTEAYGYTVMKKENENNVIEYQLNDMGIKFYIDSNQTVSNITMHIIVKNVG